MKNVLFITYYFPPAGGSGVQRPLKFIKDLPEYDWMPTVLTVRVEDAAYPGYDEALRREIPADVEVVRTRAWDPYAIYAGLLGKEKNEAVRVGLIKESEDNRWPTRIARWLRGNVFIPDARVGWVPFAVKKGRYLLGQKSYDLICTSGPPHSMHLIAYALQHYSGLPWVADLADPWTDISYYHDLPRTWAARKMESQIERKVLSSADAVVSVTDGFGQLLERRARLRRYITIANGYDEADMPDVVRVGPDRSRFVVAHVGMLSPQQNSPGLVKALAERVHRSPEWKSRLKILFVGHVDGSIYQELKQAGLEPYIELKAYVPHSEAIDYMAKADVVLAAVQRVPNCEGVVPAKIFEYLRVGTPILGLAPPGGDMDRILRQTGGGSVFAHEDSERIGAFLDLHFQRTQEERLPDAVDMEALRRYDRKFLAGRLASLFDEITSTKKAT